MREAVIKVTDPDMVAVMLRDIFIPAQDGVQNVQMVGWLKLHRRLISSVISLISINQLIQSKNVHNE